MNNKEIASILRYIHGRAMSSYLRESLTSTECEALLAGAEALWLIEDNNKHTQEDLISAYKDGYCDATTDIQDRMNLFALGRIQTPDGTILLELKNNRYNSWMRENDWRYSTKGENE